MGNDSAFSLPNFKWYTEMIRWLWFVLHLPPPQSCDMRGTGGGICGRGSLWWMLIAVSWFGVPCTALNDTEMCNEQELKRVFGKPRAFPDEALQLSTSSPLVQVSPSILHPVPHPAPLLCLKESLLRVQAVLQHPHPTFISLSKA